eukprot:354575-Chlamydomonas_euryale.AAC.20
MCAKGRGAVAAMCAGGERGGGVAADMCVRGGGKGRKSKKREERKGVLKCGREGGREKGWEREMKIEGRRWERRGRGAEGGERVG